MQPQMLQRDGTIAFQGGLIPPSNLPWYAVNEADPKDRFFTKRQTARHCMSVFTRIAQNYGYDLESHIFVEPSAGDGCFTALLPENRRIALDIAPQAPGIEQSDFLNWTPPPGTYAVIGNPPFGVRGAIALAFINRAAVFADIVGFILPMTFASDGKGGAMTRVKGLTLLHSEELAPRSFWADGGDYDVNTVFQVWGARKHDIAERSKSCDNYIEIRTVCTNPNRRCGLHLMDRYDFFIQGTFYENRPPTVVTDFADVKYGSGYGVIIKQQKAAVSEALEGVDWLRHSSRATNHCRHIRMRHIRDAIIEAGFQDSSLTHEEKNIL